MGTGGNCGAKIDGRWEKREKTCMGKNENIELYRNLKNKRSFDGKKD